MNLAITDAERFPAVFDRNSRLACPKLPSESDSQELVNMGHESDTLESELFSPIGEWLTFGTTPLVRRLGGPHLYAVILIRQAPKNRSLPRSQNRTIAIRSVHVVGESWAVNAKTVRDAGRQHLR